MSNKKNLIGKLFILSAPGGTGKTTLTKKILKDFPNIKQSISVTTRPKRPFEKDKVDYIFVDDKEFIQKRKNNSWRIPKFFLTIMEPKKKQFLLP